MTPLGLLLGWLALGPLIFGLAWVCMTVEEWLTNRATKNAAPAQRPKPAPGRATKSCTVQFDGGTFAPCTSPVQVHVNAGHEFYPFCLVHGLPYLRGGLRGDDLDLIEAYANGEAS